MKEKLFNDFPPVSAKAWKQKIQYELKGADYNQTLVYETLEGIQIKPFYHSDDLKLLSLETPTPPDIWAIGQEIYATTAEEANSKALEALEQGSESLLFTIPSETITPEVLLQGIDITRFPVYFDFRFLSPSYIELLSKVTESRRSRIHLNIDPIGQLSASGNWYSNQQNDFTALLDIVKEKKFPNTVGVNISNYQNAGANTVQQLAYALAHTNEYLNYLDPNLIQAPTFKVAVGSHYFFEIAKLRALRFLWHTLANSYGIISKCHIIATPTRRDKTVYDSRTNLVRNTTACMSAILGGANMVYNAPHDVLYQKKNEHSERLARNQLLILKNESHFDQVSDAADGSFYIESLTQQLAQKALDLFKNIEKGGGFLAQLKRGTIQQKIKECAEKEQQWFNQGKKIVVGANAYQNHNETLKQQLEMASFVKKKKPRKTLIVPILEKRLAEAMERERLMTDD